MSSRVHVNRLKNHIYSVWAVMGGTAACWNTGDESIVTWKEKHNPGYRRT